jgi:hypothetical protein
MYPAVKELPSKNWTAALACLLVYLGAFLSVYISGLMVSLPGSHPHKTSVQWQIDGFDLVFSHQHHHHAVSSVHHHHPAHKVHFVSRQKELDENAGFNLPATVFGLLYALRFNGFEVLELWQARQSFPIWPQPPPLRQSSLILKTIVLLI